MLEKQGPHYRGHSPVYFKIVKQIAQEFRMSEEEINGLYYASILHNAGAIDVPYQVLAKRSQLTPQEFQHVRDLPRKSAALIKPIEFLRPILPIVLYLHEKYDGTGYPSGLKRDQIPLGARIMGIVDAFESMVQGRPYRKRLTLVAALKEIRTYSGTQFDPAIVDVFLRLAEGKNFRNYLNSVRT
jgi:HD-GYP domain-containing protein (c-di-GMP phosphodiesterase class II)